MALGNGSLIEIVHVQRLLGQQVLNVYGYELSGYVGGTSLVAILEAYWNHVKTVTRALYPTSFTDFFQTLKGREVNNVVGDYAEYDIPVGERAGTRSLGSQGETMPIFNSVGVRLVVGTRATRPGQKRYSCLVEGDQNSGTLGAGMVASTAALMNVMTAAMLLGIPAELNELQPRIFRKLNDGTVIASQPPTGYLINSQVTTQNTRKIGRGS